MNQAVDNVLKNRVIITCPPVNPIPELPESRRDSSDLNVAEIAQKPTTLSTQSHKHKDELTHIVKVERLKDLLERINFQKQLLMREIEKSENIPGPDLEKVLKCIEQLEKEKNSLSGEIPKKVTKEQEDLVAQQNQAIKEREIKVLEREKRLADNIKELYRNYKVSFLLNINHNIFNKLFCNSIRIIR